MVARGLALVGALWSSSASATSPRQNAAPPPPSVTVPEVATAPGRKEATSPERSSDEVAAKGRARWAACKPATDPCTRSRPARAVLLSLGALGGATASALLFSLGDRLVQNDPGVLIAGVGALAGVGAITGAIAGRLGADGPLLSDRLRPATADLDYSYTGPQVLDESRPHSMSLRLAPTLFFPGGHGRMRLFGHAGGWLNPRREVDPRPQFTEVPPGQQGTAPRVLRQRRLSLGFGFDLAVALPYPIVGRSSRLGPAEIRYRPQVQVRRDRFAPGTDDSRLLERTMFLPLTVGARWHLSPRQRFTVYFGPRFDFISFSDPGQDKLRRGGTELGPLYAEAWYDIDIPLTPYPRPSGQPRALDATAQLTLGYIHSRFDGQGFDFGPVVGFFGPIHIGWATRLRPAGSRLAAQLGAYARLGQGPTLGLTLGVVAPDLYPKRRTSHL